MYAALDKALPPVSGLTSVARGENPGALERWDEQFTSVLAKVPAQLIVQIAREAVVLASLKEVATAAAALSTPAGLAKELLGHFSDSVPDTAPALAVSVVQRSVAAAVSTAFDKISTRGWSAKALDAWDATYEKLVGGESLQAQLTAVVARVSAREAAERSFTAQLTDWQAHHPGQELTDEAIERVGTDFRKRAAEAFTASFGRLPGTEDMFAGVLDWKRRIRQLESALFDHFRFEAETPAALHAAADAYTTLTEDRSADETTLVQLASAHHKDFFSAYRGLWAPRDLSASWLEEYDSAPKTSPHPAEHTRTDEPAVARQDLAGKEHHEAGPLTSPGLTTLTVPVSQSSPSGPTRTRCWTSSSSLRT